MARKAPSQVSKDSVSRKASHFTLRSRVPHLRLSNATTSKLAGFRQVVTSPAQRHDALRALLTGRISTGFLLGVILPAAYLCFLVGALIAFVKLPAGFNYGFCVLSRLASSHHNPMGHLYLTFGLIAMPVLLVPVTCWLARCSSGCPVLCVWGRTFMWVGLFCTALVGVERAWFATHWTSYELIHLAMAGIAFACLWLGLAMLAGASCASADKPRVKWQWLFRPPWYLAICVLPIAVVFGMYLPLNIVPSARSSVINSWPRSIVFLRTPTFWQWYLTLGLFAGYSFSAHRACQRLKQGDATLGSWRLDSGEPSAVHPPHPPVQTQVQDECAGVEPGAGSAQGRGAGEKPIQRDRT